MPKYTLLFCDDEIKYLQDRIDKIIADTLPETFACKYINDNDFSFDPCYDVYFLDIDMPYHTGFELAQRIYEINSEAIFVFMSSNEDYKLEGYKFHPFDFIMKCNLAIDLKRVLLELKKKLSSSKQMIMIKSEGIKLNLSDVLYIVTEDNYRNIITANDNDILLRSNDNDLQDLIEKDSIMLIRRGIWVNVQHVKKFKGDRIEMDNNQVFKVSRKLKKECYARFMNDGW